jgi:hypothetical protein
MRPARRSPPQSDDHVGYDVATPGPSPYFLDRRIVDVKSRISERSAGAGLIAINVSYRLYSVLIPGSVRDIAANRINDATAATYSSFFR